MLTSFRIDTLIVDTGCTDLDRPRGRGHGARGVVAVADHQPMPVLFELISELSDIRGDLGLQIRREHRPRALAHDLVDRRTRRAVGNTDIVGTGSTVDYLEHSGRVRDAAGHQLRRLRLSQASSVWPSLGRGR